MQLVVIWAAHMNWGGWISSGAAGHLDRLSPQYSKQYPTPALYACCCLHWLSLKRHQNTMYSRTFQVYLYKQIRRNHSNDVLLYCCFHTCRRGMEECGLPRTMPSYSVWFIWSQLFKFIFIAEDEAPGSWKRNSSWWTLPRCPHRGPVASSEWKKWWKQRIARQITEDSAALSVKQTATGQVSLLNPNIQLFVHSSLPLI